MLPNMKKPPSGANLFGTDTIGRDLFARVLVGGCYSILIGVFCAVMSSVIGAILGAVAGYFGGKMDTALIRISEIFQAFPQLVLVMMLVAIVNKRGLGNLLFIFVFTGWMTTFRMVRNEFMSIKGETYVKVCEAFGMSKNNIMFKQILPNVMSPIIVSTKMCIRDRRRQDQRRQLQRQHRSLRTGRGRCQVPGAGLGRRLVQPGGQAPSVLAGLGQHAHTADPDLRQPGGVHADVGAGGGLGPHRDRLLVPADGRQLSREPVVRDQSSLVPVQSRWVYVHRLAPLGRPRVRSG